jgi:hypothetical protein
MISLFGPLWKRINQSAQFVEGFFHLFFANRFQLFSSWFVSCFPLSED